MSPVTIFEIFLSGKAHFRVLDTNMLVSPMRNSGVGGLDQRKAPTRKFCIAVEYRLMSLVLIGIFEKFFQVLKAEFPLFKDRLQGWSQN